MRKIIREVLDDVLDGYIIMGDFLFRKWGKPLEEWIMISVVTSSWFLFDYFIDRLPLSIWGYTPLIGRLDIYGVVEFTIAGMVLFTALQEKNRVVARGTLLAIVMAITSLFTKS